MKKSKIVSAALENWKAHKFDTNGICYCLFKTQYETLNLMADDPNWYHEIANMMPPQYRGDYVDEWLKDNGIPDKLLTKKNLRSYRQAWLEHLVKYYKSIGD